MAVVPGEAGWDTLLPSIQGGSVSSAQKGTLKQVYVDQLYQILDGLDPSKQRVFGGLLDRFAYLTDVNDDGTPRYPTAVVGYLNTIYSGPGPQTALALVSASSDWAVRDPYVEAAVGTHYVVLVETTAAASVSYSVVNSIQTAVVAAGWGVQSDQYAEQPVGWAVLYFPSVVVPTDWVIHSIEERVAFLTWKVLSRNRARVGTTQYVALDWPSGTPVEAESSGFLTDETGSPFLTE